MKRYLSLLFPMLAAVTAPLASHAAEATDSVCGRISVFDIAPRTEQVYPAVLIAIDGRLPGPSGSSSYRVDPGRHVLTVAEVIDARQFSDIARLQRDRSGRERYKTLEIDVKPGITYRLGAQFHFDKRNQILDNAYWDPVIYGETAETCR